MKVKAFSFLAVAFLATMITLSFHMRAKAAVAEANVFAFEQVSATDPVDCLTCYSVTKTCLFWGCSAIIQCSQLCDFTDSDEWSVEGKCGCRGGVE
ncbi:MAG TPA: hypothetical protein PK325_12275 [Cyclobacteriaceae bacterium]|nr:hypothetical protein [Cyclobacteriaceae bacterium]HMV08761.1 hypothetical protein [Cyclobacteriaceae bacterium]HMW99906.1 hypothetical protein [Cyclobacteriaceae bacterium]HMX49231.1 hypothetical protein [Cyclobacteriaceae bacterium]HMY92727.1 hypothetical protein [Cyclobacteriaceae bacterium]